MPSPGLVQADIFGHILLDGSAGSAKRRFLLLTLGTQSDINEV
jgi:hypothetical protein